MSVPAPALSRRHHGQVSQIGRLGNLHLGDGAFESPLENDREHARHRIRAVGGRRSIGENIDAIDRELRDDRGIDNAEAGRLERNARSIDHQQRLWASCIAADIVN